MNASSLRNVQLPQTLANIDTSSFEGLTSLTTVTIPDSVRHIGARAFAQSSSLVTLSLPYKLATLGSDAFVGTKTLNIVFYCGELSGIPIKTTCTDEMKRKIEEDVYQEEKTIRDKQREAAPTPGITADLSQALDAVTKSALLATESSEQLQAIVADIAKSLNRATEKIKLISSDLAVQAAALTALIKTNLNVVTKVAKKVGA